MANLTFADSRNMVAYLEKSVENVDFAKIVDFLNANPIRFLQLFLNNQIENLKAVFNDEYDTPSHTKKVFANMRRQGKDFSGRVTPLFETMLIQHPAEVGEGLGQPTKPQYTPTTASPSHIIPIPTVALSSQPKRPKIIGKKATNISQSSGPTTLVSDETVHEERGDKVKRAATTAASLDAEQDRKKATNISQSSGPTTLVADETVHEERGDKVKRAATTAASLDAEQDSNTIYRTQSTTIPNEHIP
nr:hypothetical protein [Tanacetum cinerariifolium]